jgi:hypothetical protein
LYGQFGGRLKEKGTRGTLSVACLPNTNKSLTYLPLWLLSSRASFACRSGN